MSIQQLMLGVGAKKKTYMDDVFSTYVYTGTGSAQSINNGIDLAGEGGMTWIKGRSVGTSHIINDTVRGAGNRIYSNSDDESSSGTAFLSAFNSNGFSIGNDNDVSYDDQTFSSWSFRKAPGFFDVVTYTGNPTSGGRQIAHSLGCVPGMIMIKCTSESKDWIVYHRELGNGKALELNTTDSEATSSTYWSDTDPTSTHFTLGTSITVNGDSKDYVAYVFAGGESTAATARSVKYNGGSLVVNNHSDLDIGSGDFTIEFWFKPLSSSDHHSLIALSKYGSNVSGEISLQIYEHDRGHKIFIMDGSSYTDVSHESKTFGYGSWSHFAWTRSGSGSNNNKIFINGSLVDQFSNNFSPDNGQSWIIGANDWGQDGTPDQYTFDGNISNVRFTKGQALYTTSFKPSTTPLTTTSQGANSSNVKLLCCNNSSVTGSTVSPTSIETHGTTPTASIESPFDDPAGFVFGDAGDQNVIKCGSYVGNGQTGSSGPEIFLGFEPQWVMVKNASTANSWMMVDSMRGIIDSDSDNAEYLQANDSRDELFGGVLSLTSTGFQITHNSGHTNTNGDTYIYMCIRRPDGYVGKPADAGTDVFAMDTGNASSVGPAFDTNFAVDMAIKRTPASQHDWGTHFRLTGPKDLRTNTSDYEGNDAAGGVFDYMNGISKGSSLDSSYQSWMWKRHAGFDVVTWEGTGSTRQIPHSLNKTPEMIWVKRRNTAAVWRVYHKGLNGGSSPEGYNLNLNNSNAEENATTIWTNAPTSLNFSVGTHASTNQDDDTYIAMLFASVDGISKCGYYDGSENAQTITVGFQPRFILIKRTTSGAGGDDWVVADTLRGIGAGSNDKILYLNDNAAQSTQSLIDITSTGFTVVADYQEVNHEDHKYIYYAHA